MTITDWSTDIGLLALVLLQIRSRKLGFLQLLLPLILLGLAVWNYFTGWPTTTNGGMLLAAGAVVGVILGLAAAALTKVWNNNGTPFARATAVAAGIWILGMGVRLAFQIWAHSPGGLKDVTTFSLQHQIEQSAWVDALLFMAVGQVLARTVLLYSRGLRIRSQATLMRETVDGTLNHGVVSGR
jgi:hypothetical protein